MKYSIYIIFLLMTGLMAACQISPDKFFDKVVLNTNQIADFDPQQFGHRLEQETIEHPNIPATKKKGDEARNIVKFKIQAIEKSLSDIKALHAADDDAKVLKEQALKLYEAVWPAYKEEYSAYAKLCDSKGPEEEKEALLAQIESRYVPTVSNLFDEFYVQAKAYADKHDINVQWGF